MDGLTEGCIVHYVLSNGDHRPAIIVKVWNSDGTANMTVFTDWVNDGKEFPIKDGKFWATSVTFDDQGKRPYTWHWIEKA